MATIEYYYNKENKITSYKVKISLGYDNGKKRSPHTVSFKAPTDKNNKQIKKEAELVAAKYEE